jgi:hypothetical protein
MIPRRFPLPSLLPSFSLAVALALAGCAPSSRQHHVLSARARASAPTLPAFNPSTGGPHHLLALRVSHGAENDGRLRTPDIGEASDDNSYRSYPGNYRVERDRFSLGLDFQYAPIRQFDFFVGADVVPAVEPHLGLMTGFGLTFPIPWLHVRLAPAVGLQTYHMTAVDSIVERWSSIFGGEDSDTTWVERGGERLLPAPFAALSVSAWVPRSMTGLPFTPFAQFQWSRASMYSKTLPGEVLGLQTLTFAGGGDYAMRWGHVRGRVAREEIGHRGYNGSWRGDLTLAFRIRARE